MIFSVHLRITKSELEIQGTIAFLRNTDMSGLVMPAMWEDEVGGFQVQAQPMQLSETLSLNLKKKSKKRGLTKWLGGSNVPAAKPGTLNSIPAPTW